MLTTSTNGKLGDPSARVSTTAPEELLNDADVARVMIRKLGTTNFRVNRWTLDPLPGDLGQFGQYFNLRVTCIANEDVTPRKFVFFAKTNPPAYKTIQHDLSVRNEMLNKEIKVYEDLMPRMGAGNGTGWKCDCYLGKMNVIIVLEDVIEQGYVMPSCTRPFGVNEMRTLLRSMAKLHSRSLILDERLRREKGTTIGDEYGGILKEFFYQRDESIGIMMITVGVQLSGAVLDLIEEFDDSTKRRIKGRIEKWFPHFPRELWQPSTRFRNVTCHRDLWANNLMMKYDDAGTAVDCRLVDLQNMIYLPPAYDFMQTLQLNTSRKFRAEHFEDLARMYHELLRSELDSVDLDIDTCLGWDEFRESCDYYRSSAVIYAAINQPAGMINDKWNEVFFHEPIDVIISRANEPRKFPFLRSTFGAKKELRDVIIDTYLDVDEWIPDDPPQL